MNPMTPEEAAAAAQNLAVAVEQGAAATGQGIETGMGQLAPGLETGTNAPGGYNYQAYVAPVIDPIAKQMVVDAKQATLKQAISNAQNAAQVRYDDANFGYRQRQRDYTRKEALEAKARQKKYDSMMSSGGGGGGGLAGGAAGSNVSAVNTTATKNYIGNDDYRGRLAYLAQQGNAQAKLALQFVGNDGKYYINLKNPPNRVQDWPKITAALNAMGATNAWRG